MKRVLLLGVLVACSKHEGDIPLHIANPPTCPAGKKPATEVLLDISTDNAKYTQNIAETMKIGSSMLGERVNVKMAFCRRPCSGVQAYVREGTAKLEGDVEHGGTLTLPDGFAERPCDDAP
jgi:hypothetical protein